ncbi:DUF4838 domain-containing protein [Sphingobacterium hungaricum]
MASGNGIKIYIGKTDFAKKKLGDISQLVGEDGIVVKSIDQKNLILTGNGDRGVLYSAYEFLENYGIKFWTERDIDYPKKTLFVLSNLDIKYTPGFKYRAYYNFEANNNAEYATMLRFNGQFQPLTGGWGKPITILGWTHTFDQILPVRKYFASHPEWFTDPQNNNLPCTKNSRQPDGQETQLCLTNPEMKKEFLKNLLAWIEKNKHVELISVSQNDRGGFCNSADCNRIVSREGSASGLLLTFVNEIAKEVSKKYPTKKIITLAYNETEAPPKLIKPAENVIIQFAPINSDMFHSLNSSQNNVVGNQVSSWSKISSELFYWGYNNNFSHDLLPYPSLGRFESDVKFLKSNNVDYVFFQGGVLPDNYGYFNKMQTWVVSKLLWNPDLNIRDLINEFFNGYYGAAGKELLAYYQKVEDAFRNSHMKLNAYQNDYSFLTESTLSALTVDMNNALNRANSPIYKSRVLEEKKSNDYLMIYLNRSSDQKTDEFFENMKSYTGKSDLRSRSISNYSKNLEVRSKSRKLANIDWRTTESVIIDDENLVLDKKGTVTGHVNDNASTNTSAVYMKASSKAWSIQFPFKSKIVDPNLTYKVIASIKVQSEEKLSNQEAVIGIYNNKTKQNVFTKKIKLLDYLGDDYKNVTLDGLKLDDNCLIFLSYLNSYSEKIYLYIDSITLEKK